MTWCGSDIESFNTKIKNYYSVNNDGQSWLNFCFEDFGGNFNDLQVSLKPKKHPCTLMVG